MFLNLFDFPPFTSQQPLRCVPTLNVDVHLMCKDQRNHAWRFAFYYFMPVPCPILESIAAACARFWFRRHDSRREGRYAHAWVLPLSPRGITVVGIHIPCTRACASECFSRDCMNAYVTKTCFSYMRCC